MKIIVGITGGIAAYKSPELVRLLKKAGHEVRCAATEHALQFVTRATLETVSAAPLYCDLFRGNDNSTEHISLKDWADLLVVAPATANIIGKVAAGIADNALSTLLLAMPPERVFMAPAMNSQMWAHPAVQRNIAMLKGWGMRTIGPAEGELACGTSGPGRMVEPAEIVEAVLSTLHTPLSAQRWLVTAGPTYERIDSATALSISHPRVHRTDVESAREMYAAATALYPSCRGAILSAAVADYRPSECADHKLKKQGDEGMTLTLVQNPDILASLGKMKTSSQLLVGFALETDNELQNAQGKLQRKNLDYIVMNSLRDAGAGFGTDTNKVTILGADGSRRDVGLRSKQEVAREIVSTVTS